jgi:hypothetical protein
MTTIQEQALARASTTPSSGVGSGDWLGTSQKATGSAIPQSTVSTPVSAPIGSTARDFEREQEALQNLGLDPANIANINPQTLFENTYTEEELAGIEDYQKIKQFKDSQARLNATPKPTNTMMAGLENALRIKSDVGNQEMGPSELFEKAGIQTKGVGGYATLNSALQNNSTIMKDRYNSFASTIEKTGNALNDTYNAVLDEYKVALDEYEMVNDNFNTVLNNVMRKQEAIDLAEKQAELEIQAKEWAAKNLDPESLADLQDKGYTVDGNGKIIKLASPAGQISIGNTAELSNIYSLSGKSKYRASGFECAEGSNKLVEGSHLGSDYATEKMPYVKKRDNPEIGNQVVFPLEGSGNYGHAGTVIDIDKANGTFSTVEWNHNGDGKQTFHTYSIDQFNQMYGSNWGFTNSKMKAQYSEAATATQGKIEDMKLEESPDWFQKYVKDYYPNYSESEIRTMIKNRTDLTKEEQASYVALFDRVINESKGKVNLGNVQKEVESADGFWDKLKTGISSMGDELSNLETYKQSKEGKPSTTKTTTSSTSSGSSRPSLAELLKQ